MNLPCGSYRATDNLRQVVAIVLKGYPRLSETFIAQEILSLQRMGLDYSLVSLRHPTDKRIHPINNEITAPVNYLPEYLYQEPARLFKSWLAVRNLAGYKTAWRTWFGDLKRDFTPNRIRRFGQAVVLAHELPRDVSLLYAHFLHTPASVARYTAQMRDISWSCSAHAKDIWTSPQWEKVEKVRDMEWLVTCTSANSDHLKKLAGQSADKITLLYHGLDFSRFPARSSDYMTRDGSKSDDPVHLLSVGRAVEKKGYNILIDALAQLPSELNWKFTHIGGGTLSDQLKQLAEAKGLSNRIEWLGALPQEEVLAQYKKSDVFVLASLIAKDGDRDGLPNVLMEAQSQGVTCISTAVSAVPELIEDGATGLLVEPGDAAALSQGLCELITNPRLREQLGRAGDKRVRETFEHAGNLGELAAKFDLPQTSSQP